MSDPTFVGGSAQAVYPTSSHVVSNPGVVAGDLMVQFMYWYVPYGTTLTPPSGWVQRQAWATLIGESYEIYTKIATGSEPATYTWGFAGSTSVFAALCAYTGNTTDNMSMTAATNGAGGPAYFWNAGSTPQTAGGNNDHARVLQLSAWWDGNGGLVGGAADPATTPRFSVNRGGQYFIVADEILTTPSRPVRTLQGSGFGGEVNCSPGFEISIPYSGGNWAWVS